jgi:hypothetical protein
MLMMMMILLMMLLLMLLLLLLMMMMLLLMMMVELIHPNLQTSDSLREIIVVVTHRVNRDLHLVDRLR